MGDHEFTPPPCAAPPPMSEGPTLHPSVYRSISPCLYLYIYPCRRWHVCRKLPLSFWLSVRVYALRFRCCFSARASQVGRMPQSDAMFSLSSNLLDGPCADIQVGRMPHSDVLTVLCADTQACSIVLPEDFAARPSSPPHLAEQAPSLKVF